MVSLDVVAENTQMKQLIPILIAIDAEPDGVFIDPEQRVPWHGFERSAAVIERWREDLERATGRAVHVTWLLRMDPQIEKVYGSLQWSVENYAGRLERMARQGDEIGLHVHTYRWTSGNNEWVVDLSHQDWVEQCVELGYQAFTDALGRTPRSFSMGSSWLNQPTVRKLEDLGIRYDLSLLQGVGSTSIGKMVGRRKGTGTMPDCSNLSGPPFRPSLEDFTIPDPARREGVWLIPVSTGTFQFPLWRRVLNRLRGRQDDPSRPKKLSLGLGASLLGPGFDHCLEASGRRHVLLTVRSSQFAVARSRMESSIQFLASHPEVGRFVFSTAAEAVNLLGLESEGEEGSRF